MLSCGAGYLRREESPHSGLRAYRKAVSAYVGKEEDDQLYVKAVQQSIQGSWTKWQNIVRRDMSWNTILSKSPRLITFALGATYNTVVSPVNMKRWGLADEDTCELCRKGWCDIKHILSGCTVALAQGRYRYRHDAVLKKIAHGLAQSINQQNNARDGTKRLKKTGIEFVREGHEPKKTCSAKGKDGLLYEANDWTMDVDIGRQLKFPNIVVTGLRPDVVIKSANTKSLIIIELTCPSEENLEARHQDKISRYEGLAGSCRKAGWKTHLFAVEVQVGARGLRV